MSFMSGDTEGIPNWMNVIFGGPKAWGAMAGDKKDVTTNTYTVDSHLSDYGTYAQNIGQNTLANLGSLYGSATQYNQGGPALYAQMLQQYAQNGGLPNQQQIGYANQYASNIFSPQQAALNNMYNQAQIDTSRQSAMLGRPTDDPILRAKLAQYQGQQQNVLSGQQTSLASQLAMQLPQQQLGYAERLATNAIGNQAALFGLGGQALQNQQSWALQNATRTATSMGGGGMKGALAGAFQGGTLGLQGYSAFSPMMSGSKSSSEDSGSGSGSGIGALAGMAAAVP